METDYELVARQILESHGLQIWRSKNRHYDFNGHLSGQTFIIEAKGGSTLSKDEMKTLREAAGKGKRVLLIINDLEGRYVLFEAMKIVRRRRPTLVLPRKSLIPSLPPELLGSKLTAFRWAVAEAMKDSHSIDPKVFSLLAPGVPSSGSVS